MGWNWSWVELAALPDKFLVSGHPAWWLSSNHKVFGFNPHTLAEVPRKDCPGNVQLQTDRPSRPQLCQWVPALGRPVTMATRLGGSGSQN